MVITVGDDARGVALLEESLAIKEAVHGPSHASLISTLTGLGNAYTNRGRRDLGGARLRRALEITERELGAESPRLGNLLHNFANFALRGGAHREAIEAAERSAAIQAASLGADHPALVTTLEIRALGHLGEGELEAADEAITRALAILALAHDEGSLSAVERANARITAARIRGARGAPEAEVRALAEAAAADAGDELDDEEREHLRALLGGGASAARTLTPGAAPEG